MGVFLYAVFGLGVAAFAALIGYGIVRRLRGRRNEAWQDDEVHVHPGAGWGNGGSWT
ncbi:hypothetical protein RKE38_18530 [Phycicoccus sp. M110.8]|jgi:hypothetical protein|uniref:hypothetical protein n=1 Tax=unclassified Phycicoccus TaxID=2637926 RepID=UPI00285886AC|nr:MULTISPECIES: hypothetical protein [unclassified Phycicoccus]MDR6865217.1 hypothetical protein [Phycicoccus sp. 3266]MDU0315700.1 hypothetical protein [Phycicoccus sp. M110.8]